jgi:hypothetical protein
MQQCPQCDRRGLPSRRCIDFPFNRRFQESGIARRRRLRKASRPLPIDLGASITSNGATGPADQTPACCTATVASTA